MVAVKGNVEYRITEAEKAMYIKNGFDILDDSGKKIADGAHKTVSYEQYEKVRKELEELKAKGSDNSEIEKLNGKIADLETQELKEQIDALTNALGVAKEQNNTLTNELEVATAQNKTQEEDIKAKDKKIADLEKKLAK